MSARLLALLLTAVLGLAACGTAEEAEEPTATDPTPAEDATPDAADDAAVGETPEQAEPVVRAVDATVDEGSAAFDAVVVVDSAEFSDRLETSGVVDFAGEQRQLDLTTPGGDLAALITADGIHVSLGEGAGWVRADPSQLQGTPLEAYGLATIPLQDPAVNLGLLRGATEDVTEAGEEDIDGEATTRYEVVVDVERAAAQADAATADAIRSAGGQNETVAMDVWVDDSDRIRRIEHRTELAETELVEGQVDGSIEVTIDFSDFGTEVTIEQPDEGEVIDVDEQTLEQLVRQLTGEGMTAPGMGTDADADTDTDADADADADADTDAEDTQGVEGDDTDS
jgi:hypothetical protein